MQNVPSALPPPSDGGQGRWLTYVLAATFVVALPALAGGFLMDDALFVAQLEGRYPAASSWWSLYAMGHGSPALNAPLMAQGALPWWTHETFQVAFLRPLSSGLFALEHALWGRAAWAYHVVGLLLYVGLVWTAGALFRRVLRPRAAVLATVVFAFNDAHALPIGWLANHHALLSLLLGLLGVHAYLRWRSQQWRAGGLLATLAFVGALLAGESGLCAIGYVVAYECVIGRRLAATHGSSSAAPWLGGLLLMALYMSVYVVGDYGVRGSGVYIDPHTAPAEFLLQAPGHLAALLAGLTWSAPVVLWIAAPASRTVLVFLGCAGVGLWWAFARGLRSTLDPSTRAGLGWLSLGALAALAPVASTFPLDRLLLAADVGAAGVLGALLDALLRARVSATRPRRVLVFVAVLLATLHLVLSPLLLPVLLWGQTQLAGATRTIAREAEVPDPASPAIVLAAPDFDVGMYLPWVRGLETDAWPSSYNVLAYVGEDVVLSRPHHDALELHLPKGLLHGFYARAFRRPADPIPDRVEIPGGPFDVTVLARSEGSPTHVRFDFGAPLESIDVVFLHWQDGRLRRYTLPPVGGEATLPFSAATGLAAP